MSTERRQGFILTFVIVMVGLVAVVMFVLTGGANTMLFEADTAYIQAVDRNLVASGLAWARRQAQEGAATSDEPVSLEMGAPGARQASLTVRIAEQDGAVRCQIETSVAKGRQSASHSRAYVLTAP
jgi:hypothetical protein